MVFEKGINENHCCRYMVSQILDDKGIVTFDNTKCVYVLHPHGLDSRASMNFCPWCGANFKGGGTRESILQPTCERVLKDFDSEE